MDNVFLIKLWCYGSTSCDFSHALDPPTQQGMASWLLQLVIFKYGTVFNQVAFAWLSLVPKAP